MNSIKNNKEIERSDRQKNIYNIYKTNNDLTLASPDLLGAFYDHVDDKMAQL